MRFGIPKERSDRASSDRIKKRDPSPLGNQPTPQRPRLMYQSRLSFASTIPEALDVQPPTPVASPQLRNSQSTQHAFSRRLTNPTPPGGTPQPQGELYRDGDTAPPVFGFGDLTVTNPAPADDGARVRLGDALTSATGVILHSAAQAKSATGAAIRDHIITEELEFRTMTAAAAKGVSRIPTPTVNWNKWVEDTSPVDVPDSLSDDATWARLRSYAAAQPPDSLPPTPAASSQPLLLQSPEPRVVEISSDDDVVISTHAFGHAPRSSSNPATAASFNAFDKKALTSRSSLEAPLPASKTLVLRPPVVQPESSRSSPEAPLPASNTLVLRPPVVQPESSRSPPEAPASSPDVMVLRSSKVAKAARSSLGASPKAPDVKPSQSSNTFETNRSSTETPAPTREVKTLQSSSVPTTAHPAHAAPTSSGTMVLRSAHVNSTATAPLAAIFTRRRPFGPRRPEFDGLVGRRLLNAMKDLPRWEQAQACNAFFDESEVMLLYLADVQTISTSWRPPRGGRDPMVAAMAAGGFKPLRAGSSSSYTSPLNTAGLNLRLCLAALNAAPVVIQPNNPYGAPVSSFLLRGPVEVRVFTLNDYHTSPGSLLKSARPIWAVGMPGACLSAKFDAFYDPVIRSYFADYYFGRLRLLDPTLKPWKFDQTIESVNPQLADPSHPLRGCTQVFWSSGYHDPDRTTLASVNEPSVLVYCREHDRKEGFNMCSARMFKLSSGYFTHQEWLDGTYDLHKSNDAFRTTHGSHPCGNGKWCLALFEMVWEPVRYNMGRKSCHETAADVEDGFCDCHVCRMTGVPCNLAAHRMDPSVLRSRNMAIINDHFADGSINSCPICLEQISTASNIEEYMGPALRVMREHLRERHGHTDEWASLVARW